MIPLWFSQISSKIRKFQGPQIVSLISTSECDFASSFFGLFESGSASVNWCRMDEITKRIAAPKFQIIEKNPHEKILTWPEARQMTPKVLLLFFRTNREKEIAWPKNQEEISKSRKMFLNKNFLDAFLALRLYKEFSRIILTVFIIFRFPHSFFCLKLNCVNRYSKSDFPRSKKHNPSQGKKTPNTRAPSWRLVFKSKVPNFVHQKNVSFGAARDPIHIPKKRDHGLRGVSAVRDVLLNFWEVSHEKT